MTPYTTHMEYDRDPFGPVITLTFICQGKTIYTLYVSPDSVYVKQHFCTKRIPKSILENILSTCFTIREAWYQSMVKCYPFHADLNSLHDEIHDTILKSEELPIINIKDKVKVNWKKMTTRHFVDYHTSYKRWFGIALPYTIEYFLTSGPFDGNRQPYWYANNT